MPSPALRLRGCLPPLHRPDPAAQKLPPPALDLLPGQGQGQGGEPPAASAGVVVGEMAPGGGAAVRDARPPRQAYRHLAPRLALHVVDHDSGDARGAPRLEDAGTLWMRSCPPQGGWLHSE